MQGDIGKVEKPGLSVYIPQTSQYVISGGGSNIWNDHDEFHFVWKKIKGDFILYTRADFVGSTGVDPHRKYGWMIRKTLEENAAFICAAEHGDGLTSLQYRKTIGASAEETRSAITHANILQLERKGNIYTMRVAKFGEPFTIVQVKDIDLGEDVYAGMFVCSHNADVLETAIFKDVRISIPADNKTEMTLGSNLELLDIASGNREIVYTVPYSIQGPNWTVDGKSLILI